MCIPCGPKWSGTPGRKSFYTLDDTMDIDISYVREKWSDDNTAIEKIKNLIDKHICNTEKWIIDYIYEYDRYLCRIYAENRIEIHKYYLKAKREWKNKQ